jgi:dTDP-4-amino-4,6-dideoxygalactose transaminase
VFAGVAPRNVLEVVRERIARDYGSSDAVLTDSGTSALRLGIEAAIAESKGRNPLVALPAYSCFDVATAADGAEARVALYDIDPVTLSPSPDSFHAALALRPAAVVIAHLYGLAADPGLFAAAAAGGSVVIDDAAQGVGGTSHGRPLGSRGHLGVLSFGRGKGRTAGHGGALIANDARGARILELARSRAAPARAALKDAVSLLAQWALARPTWYRLPASLPFLRLGDTLYRVPWPPRAMDPRAGGVLASTWDLSPAETEARRANAARLAEMLADRRAVQLIQPLPGTVAGFLRFPALLPSGSLDHAARELGIMPGYPEVLPDLREFRFRCLEPDGSFMGARVLARKLVTFPTHSLLREPDLQAIEEWVSVRFPRGL